MVQHKGGKTRSVVGWQSGVERINNEHKHQH